MIRHGISNKTLAREGMEKDAPYPSRPMTTIRLDCGMSFVLPRKFPAFRWASAEEWAKENVPTRHQHEFYRRFGLWEGAQTETIEKRKRLEGS